MPKRDWRMEPIELKESTFVVWWLHELFVLKSYCIVERCGVWTFLLGLLVHERGGSGGKEVYV
jgi:hypothetical protein